MNYYLLLTNPLVKKIFLEGVNEGFLKKKIGADISTIEWDNFIERKFAFSTKHLIQSIKIYEDGVTSLYSRGEHEKFFEIVYNESFDWDNVFSIKINDEEFLIGDKVTSKEDKKKYTISKFKMSSKSYSNNIKIFTNCIDVYVDELIDSPLCEATNLLKYKEPLGYTYDKYPIYTGDVIWVYNLETQMKYHITVQSTTFALNNGVKVIKHNVGDEESWLKFAKLESLLEYQAHSQIKYSMLDIKRIIENISKNFDIKININDMIK